MTEQNGTTYLINQVASPENIWQATKQVISKKGAGGIDQMVQQAILQVISPLIDPDFSDYS